ncbi:MAG: 2Fe-2S iron-sulfur cluster-binding protein [Thermoguttaceae bacterium]|jgi:NADH-quinone oxidoreductase subunit G
MPKVIIDGRELEIPAGRRVNAIEAAALVGIQIPFYCYHPGLAVVGSCRMCLVEVGRVDAKTGAVSLGPKLAPACNTLLSDGMVVVTNSEKVRRARAMVEEGLLLRHPIDCPICDKAGECLLQDYHFQHGQDARRADLLPVTSRRCDLGDVTLFIDRCVMCSRCVRFCQTVSGTGELMVTRRGARAEIDVVPGFPLHNNLSGNVVDLCPVGALADKDFLYQQRVWFLRSHEAVCTGCAIGCSIWVQENQDRVYRLKPRDNPHVNKWWICNEGRYGYHHVHDRRRLAEPRHRPHGGQSVALGWDGLVDELRDKLHSAGRLAGVLSPMLTAEEAFLLCQFLRDIDPQAELALGPVPRVGQEQVFSGFVVSAEKCPNRRGVTEVVAHFAKRLQTFEEFLAGLPGSNIRGAWIAGGYQSDWIDEPTAGRLAAVPLLVVQDLFPSPLSERATYELPGAAFAEREGSYVNRGDRLQVSRLAVRPPWGVHPEGELYWELLQRKGLYDARAVLDELARQILYFSAAAGPVPDVGIDLKINLLAHADSEPAA